MRRRDRRRQRGRHRLCLGQHGRQRRLCLPSCRQRRCGRAGQYRRYSWATASSSFDRHRRRPNHAQPSCRAGRSSAARHNRSYRSMRCRTVAWSRRSHRRRADAKSSPTCNTPQKKPPTVTLAVGWRLPDRMNLTRLRRSRSLPPAYRAGAIDGTPSAAAILAVHAGGDERHYLLVRAGRQARPHRRSLLGGRIIFRSVTVEDNRDRRHAHRGAGRFRAAPACVVGLRAAGWRTHPGIWRGSSRPAPKPKLNETPSLRPICLHAATAFCWRMAVRPYPFAMSGR